MLSSSSAAWDRVRASNAFVHRMRKAIPYEALLVNGLVTGFTRPNLEILWIDPYEYNDTLSEAVALLNSYGMTASVTTINFARSILTCWGITESL